MQVDGAAVSVFVTDAGYATADGGGDAQLFVEFADEGLLGGLAGLDLSAGELPFEAHGLIGAALADQDFAMIGLDLGAGVWRAQDEGRYDPADG